jgi:hypothetical protein
MTALASEKYRGIIVFYVFMRICGWESGMDVVSAVSMVPTYKPSSRIRQFNNFAELLGDDRAANARSLWNKPLKAIVIKSCGVLDIARKFS